MLSIWVRLTFEESVKETKNIENVMKYTKRKLIIKEPLLFILIKIYLIIYCPIIANYFPQAKIIILKTP